MKLTITGAELHAGAAWAARLCPARPTSPALAGVLLDCSGGDALQLTASDLDTTGRVHVSAFVQEPGRVLVSGRLLGDIAKTIAKEDNVALQVDGTRLVVQVGRGKWAMPLLPVEDYPELPFPGTALGTVNADRFAHELERVLVAVGDGGPADVMGGAVAIGTQDDGQLFAAATDRFRAAIAVVPWTSDGDMPEVLVPSALIRPTIAAVRSGGDVALHSDGFTISMVTATHSVTGRLVDLKSVWRNADISPDSKFLTTVRVRTDDLRRALERATVGTHADDKVALRVDADEVGIRPLEGSQADGEHVAATVSFDGEDREVGIRPRYFADLLGNLEAPVVQIEFAYLRKAMLMLARGVDDAGELIPGFHMTQAPMKLASGTAAA